MRRNEISTNSAIVPAGADRCRPKSGGAVELRGRAIRDLQIKLRKFVLSGRSQCGFSRRLGISAGVGSSAVSAGYLVVVRQPQGSQSLGGDGPPAPTCALRSARPRLRIQVIVDVEIPAGEHVVPSFGERGHHVATSGEIGIRIFAFAIPQHGHPVADPLLRLRRCNGASSHVGDDGARIERECADPRRAQLQIDGLLRGLK